MTIIEHETSPAVAVRIAKSGLALGGPIMGDGGLNCVAVNHPAGPPHPGQALGRGAVMRFDWTGPSTNVSPSNGIYQPNLLYDEHPHRAMVPIGTNQHLRLIGITLVGGASWADVIQQPQLTFDSFGEWIRSLRSGWTERAASTLGAEMQATVAKQPLISVGFPEHCIYRSFVQAAFPGHNWPN